MAPLKNKKLLLTLNPKLYDALVKKADERMMTPQEYVYSMLREKVFAPPATAAKKSHAGRPKQVDDKFLQYFTRDR